MVKLFYLTFTTLLSTLLKFWSLQWLCEAICRIFLASQVLDSNVARIDLLPYVVVSHSRVALLRSHVDLLSPGLGNTGIRMRNLRAVIVSAWNPTSTKSFSLVDYVSKDCHTITRSSLLTGRIHFPELVMDGKGQEVRG